MNERLVSEESRFTKKPLIAALGERCLGCPLVELCAQKPVPNCEQKGVPDAQAEAQKTTSYRDQLMDEGIPFVMARSVRLSAPSVPPNVGKPSQPTQDLKRKPHILPAIGTTPMHTAKPKFTKYIKPRETKRPQVRNGETCSEIIAEIFALAFSANCVTAAQRKKR